MKTNNVTVINLRGSLIAALLIMAALSSGCKTNNKPASKEVITDKTWEMTRLRGNELNMSDYPDGVPTITFTTDGSISGKTGCNSYQGSYELNGESISLDLGSMTKMMCDGPGEMNFVFAINEATRVKVDERGLSLLYGSKEVLGFKAK